jgi:S1-C subfamily serine protease
MNLITSLTISFFTLTAASTVFADQNEDLRTTQEKSKKLPIQPPAATESIEDAKVEKLKPKQADVVAKPVRDGQCVPSFAKGSPNKMHGLKCIRVKPGSELARAGIVEGDIVMSIDGEILNSPSAAAILHSKAKTHQFSEIRVLRNGEETVLH